MQLVENWLCDEVFTQDRSDFRVDFVPLHTGSLVDDAESAARPSATDYSTESDLGTPVDYPVRCGNVLLRRSLGPQFGKSDVGILQPSYAPAGT